MKILYKLIDKKTLTVNWGYVYKINSFRVLCNTYQNPKWHGEGSVMAHTENVVNEIYQLLPNFSDKESYNRRLILVAAALFHDIGKGVTTYYDETYGTYKSPNHEIEGEKLARRILWNEDIEIREKICTLVRNHMIPLKITDNNKKYDLIKLSMENVSICDLLTLKRADCSGSIQSEYDYWREKINDLENFAIKFHCYKNKYYFSNQEEECFFIKNGRLPKTNDEVRTMDFTVYMMIGLPGAGKSTYIKEKLYNMEIVSRDNIRNGLGILNHANGNYIQEKMVDDIFERRIKTNAAKHFSFVVDNTNLKKSYRDKIKYMLKEYTVQYVYIYVESPRLIYNLNRRFDSIKPYIITSMRDSFEYPRAYEYNSIKIFKQKDTLYGRIKNRLLFISNIIHELCPSGPR